MFASGRDLSFGLKPMFGSSRLLLVQIYWGSSGGEIDILEHLGPHLLRDKDTSVSVYAASPTAIQ